MQPIIVDNFSIFLLYSFLNIQHYTEKYTFRSGAEGISYPGAVPSRRIRKQGRTPAAHGPEPLYEYWTKLLETIKSGICILWLPPWQSPGKYAVQFLFLQIRMDANRGETSVDETVSERFIKK
jgi:hypothetical protein